VNFDEPGLLWGLWLLLPLAILAPRRYFRRRHALLALIGAASVGDARRLMDGLRRRYTASTVFFLAFLAATLLALAGPRWGSRLVPEYRRGVDVVIALDLSRSMEARDLAPSRLGRAAALAMDTVNGSPGTRFAVTVGKGSAVLALPLTEDAESLGSFFRGVSSAGISSGGTDLERLLDASLGAFQPDFPARKKILLLSDGEALSGSLQQAAERSAAAGAAIIAVGLGSVAGAEVPDLKREDGSVVPTRLREGDLRAAAQRSGGIYVDGALPDAAETIRAYIAAAAASTALEGFRRESVSRRHWFLLAALAAFALSRLAETGFRRKA